MDFDGNPSREGFEDERPVGGTLEARAVMKLDGDVTIGERGTATNQQDHSLVRTRRGKEVSW